MADTLARISIGARLHAMYVEDGQYYPAIVLAVSSAKNRAKKPVKVSFVGYELEVWVSIDSLKSKALGLRPDKVSTPKGKAAATISSLETRISELESEVARLTHASQGHQVEILPDMVQVHAAISRAADRVTQISDLEHLPISRSEGGRMWMFNLMPIWNWQTSTGPPSAEEFWRLAHAVARDQNRDDWVAPHITLHSRSKDLNGLATNFLKLVNDLGKHVWKELLFTLRTESNWNFDEDTNAMTNSPPSSPDHSVLHKARIDMPEAFRAWLDQNQNAENLQPRKQDRDKRKPRADGSFRIGQIFHISLYSFRAARKHAVSRERTNSYTQIEPRIAHHVLPKEDDVRKDLARADWMLVFCSPGWTGTPACSPTVLTSVRLADLASGALVN